jgi:hypothetical protein
MASNDWLCLVQSMKFAAEMPLRRPRGGFSHSWTIRSGSG